MTSRLTKAKEIIEQKKVDEIVSLYHNNKSLKEISEQLNIPIDDITTVLLLYELLDIKIKEETNILKTKFLNKLVYVFVLNERLSARGILQEITENHIIIKTDAAYWRTDKDEHKPIRYIPMEYVRWIDLDNDEEKR